MGELLIGRMVQTLIRGRTSPTVSPVAGVRKPPLAGLDRCIWHGEPFGPLPLSASFLRTPSVALLKPTSDSELDESPLPRCAHQEREEQ